MGRREALIALIDEFAVAVVIVIVAVFVLYRAHVLSLLAGLIISIAATAALTFTGYLAAKEQLKSPRVGAEALIGNVGVAVEDLNPSGIVLLNGEYWTASSIDGRFVPRGSKVAVISVRGLRLIVRPLEVGEGRRT
ncbi:MAG: NfeD family protein [Fervidicoccaceae archaeon]